MSNEDYYEAIERVERNLSTGKDLIANIDTLNELTGGGITAAPLMLAKDAIDLAKSLREIPDAVRGLRNVFKAMGEARAAAAAGREICFVAGTQIMTVTGKKSIEDIIPGDSVLSRDEVTGEVAYKPVLQVFVTHPTKLVHLTYRLDEANASSPTKQFGRQPCTLVGTPNHPFWSLTRSAWISMGDLVPGDRLLLSDGTEAIVIESTNETAPLGTTFTTYNFEVADWHTYFVTPEIAGPLATGVWVHNLGNLCAEGIETLAQTIQKMKPKDQQRYLAGIYRHTQVTSADLYKILRKSGMDPKKAATIRDSVRNAAKIGQEMHHVLPEAKEFSAYFASKGLDIQEFTVDLAKQMHRLKPGGLHTNQGGIPGTNWNAVWKTWIASPAGQAAGKEEVLAQATRMMRDFGLTD